MCTCTREVTVCWALLMTGNKLVFMVTDPSKFSVQGDGLGPLIRVNQTATFNVSAPCAQIEDLGVSISGSVYSFIHSFISFF